jgi:hypothetical protein
MGRILAVWPLLRRLQFVILGWRQRLGEQRVEQAAAGGGGGGEARLQPVADRHQRIDLGNDAVLFGKWWERNAKRPNIVEVEPWPSRTISAFDKFGSPAGRGHEAQKEPFRKPLIDWPHEAGVLAYICLAQIVIQQRRIRDARTRDDDKEIAFGNLRALSFRVGWRVHEG